MLPDTTRVGTELAPLLVVRHHVFAMLQILDMLQVRRQLLTALVPSAAPESEAVGAQRPRLSKLAGQPSTIDRLTTNSTYDT